MQNVEEMVLEDSKEYRGIPLSDKMECATDIYNINEISKTSCGAKETGKKICSAGLHLCGVLEEARLGYRDRN